MTKNIIILKAILKAIEKDGACTVSEDVVEETIKALYEISDSLKELQRYREIGTVEECREAREKQRTKKVINFLPFSGAHCPSCEAIIEAHTSKIYCPYCGQKLDWSEKE